MTYKHAYLDTLLLLHSTLMLSVVKMSLNEEVGGHALESHGNDIVDRGKSWKNHGIVFFNFCGNLENSAKKFIEMNELSFKRSDFNGRKMRCPII